MFFTTCSGEIFTVQTPVFEKDPKDLFVEERIDELKRGKEDMAPARVEEGGFATSIPEVPVTEERKPWVQKEGDERLKDPGTARANIAASFESPHGTQKGNYAAQNTHLTVLQQHLSFFDRSHSGIIYPLDTYIGFSRLGYNPFICLLSVLVIHLNFSYPTLKTWYPDIRCRIYIDRIHKDKHGSDSGTYDNEGRFVPQKFEEIFSKYASGDKEGIYWGEVINYMKGQRVVGDPFGWGGALFEWVATYLLLWPEDGRMKKDDIRRIYDGSLFFEIAERREEKKQK